MIDAHAHLQGPPPAGVRVRGWLVPGVDTARDADAARWAPGCPGVARAVGLHPWWVGEDLDAALDALDARAGAADVVAVGECGLDRGRRAGPRELQERALHHQLALAARHELPLILHCVRAHGRCQALVDEAPGPLRGMVHDFGGSAQSAREWLRRGFLLSVSPRGLRRPDLLRALPGEALLVETDEAGPEALEPLICALARLRGEDAAALAERCARNARDLFPGAPWTGGASCPHCSP